MASKVSEQTEQHPQQHPPCPACGGSGQINFFQGESRFLLSVEECLLCSGFGYVQEEDGAGGPKKKTDKSGGKA